MAKVLVLETDPTMRNNLKTALNAAGHQVHVVTKGAEVPPELRNRQYDLLVISDNALNGASAQLATEAEKRSVKTVIMATSQSRLEDLRAKGLICFRVPDTLEDLQGAICARI